jgi:hypothetical protein
MCTAFQVNSIADFPCDCTSTATSGSDPSADTQRIKDESSQHVCIYFEILYSHDGEYDVRTGTGFCTR